MKQNIPQTHHHGYLNAGCLLMLTFVWDVDWRFYCLCVFCSSTERICMRREGTADGPLITHLPLKQLVLKPSFDISLLGFYCIIQQEAAGELVKHRCCFYVGKSEQRCFVETSWWWPTSRHTDNVRDTWNIYRVCVFLHFFKIIFIYFFIPDSFSVVKNPVLLYVVSDQWIQLQKVGQIRLHHSQWCVCVCVCV